MNQELCLVKLLFRQEIFLKYNTYVNSKYLKDINKELSQVFLCLEDFHQKYPGKDVANVAELELHFYTCFPAMSQRDRDVYSAIFAKVADIEVDPVLAEGYVKTLQERLKASRLAVHALEVSEGRKDWQSLSEAVLEASRGIEEPLEQDDPFVSSSLAEIAAIYDKPGLRWRLNTLNRMMGSLRKGNYGFIFARPETGKTTFLASEVTFMAEQLGPDDGPIIWFNNEQPGHEVMEYLYRASLGLTTQELHAKIEVYENEYKLRVGERIKIYDNAAIYKRDVERVAARFNPSLMVFDQIDKLKGFESDRDDLKLGSIYQWARELAKKYCPVIGVCQAGESGSNKRYLTMEDVVNAKTAKQAEADWILGIGKLNQSGYENLRHLHLSKNKLVGDKDTDPALRHGMCDVLIFPQIARYKDTK